MSNLLERYEEMQKIAELEAIEEEKVDVLIKYASLAEELLSESFNENDYDEEDVIKVAEFLIESDLAVEEEIEKIAEYDSLGRILARSFVDELENIGG